MKITLNADPGSEITINVSSSPSGARTESMGSSASGELETKKEDTELGMDYSGCLGYVEEFMGFNVPIPELEKQLLRKAAKFDDNSDQYILPYYNFSTVQHSIRKMPIFSAINIEGSPKKRKDTKKRKDQWLRDNRIDMDVQLTDDFYKYSGFDKGHMTRREDANWGGSGAVAFRNAQLTCMYTNACPQVPELNRAVFGYHGLWGQLEQIVLEQGVIEEEGKAGKICVFNGPIFVSTDPTYKDIQVPLRFFKVIVWINGKGEKKTTAFILSQEDLVDGIKFEELQYDEEFKEHQCSIPYLENITDLKFNVMSAWDTYKDRNGKAVARIKRGELESLVNENK
ncbi:MAG: DNA/RNA non-specific endonuclease [Chitinophagaceae bacterium]